MVTKKFSFLRQGGETISRRALLVGSAASSVGLPNLVRAASAVAPADLKELSAALSSISPATAMDRRGQDAYVLRAAAQALTIASIPRPDFFPMGAHAPGVEVGPVGRAGPAMIIRYRLAPGGILPPHNHPNYSVATIGIAGDAIVQQFEIVGEMPAFSSSTGFNVRRVAERRLGAGDVVALSPQHDNIHTFVAGANGAEFYDVTTAHGPDVGFSYLALENVRGIDALIPARWGIPK
jgi:hypothetical protein